MGRTRQKPPTVQRGFRKLPNGKVCIVCVGRLARDRSKLEYMLYVVDVDRLPIDPCEIKRLPIVRISDESFSYPAICILGSKLFIFEGYCWGPEDFDKCYNPDGKSIFTYDLSLYNLNIGTNLELDKSMMVKEAVGMNDVKSWPKATATPNGKILVFSSKLETDPHEGSDFELYDPATRTCLKLPNLPGEEISCVPITCIKAFTFMEGNVFLVRTEMHGVFAIDLGRPPKDWTWKKSAFRGDECIPSHSSDTFVVIGKKICLTPDFAYDIRVRKGRPRRLPSDDGRVVEENMFARLRYYFPDQSSVPYHCSCQTEGVTLLDPVYKGGIRVCFITTVVNEETMHPELMLAVYVFDLNTCLERLAEHRRRKEEEDPVWWKRKREDVVFPETSKDRSLKIIVPEQYDALNLCYFSSLGF